MKSAALILAAGSSSRMGESKQLLDVGGKSLLEHTITTVKPLFDITLVVLGSRFQQHRPIVERIQTELIVNTNWELGMGNSIKAGVQELIKSNPDSITIFVSDQPHLSGAVIWQIAEAAKENPNRIIASSYGDTYGVPVRFPKKYHHLLLEIGDEDGAKKLVRRFQAEVTGVAFPEGVIDLDTPDDYQKFINSMK